jgi:GNAT superfamily N-acetyltransferase
VTDIHVRRATPQDEDEMMVLCRMLHTENGLFEMDEDRVRGILRRGMLHSGDKKHDDENVGGIVGVIGGSGKIEAIISIIISQMWYSSAWVLEELFSYVHPDYRKTSNAKHLISFAKKCSDEIGIPLLIGVISNDRTEAKVRLYRRQLAEPAGAFFLYGNKKVA